MSTTKPRVARLGLAAALITTPVAGVTASPRAEASDDVIEEVISIGTRTAGRTALDTAVPVDVFQPEQLESVNSSDLTDVIATLVPSFNVGRQPISDGATFIRPPQLRGLDSDKSLVLVNGKRRHRAALVVLGGFGSHGPDLGTIPTIALDQVEVLRDGASAQYGSDAIAGVLNFRLREDAEGLEVRSRYGEYAEGDGDDLQVEVNWGLPLGDRGFLNLSAQIADAEMTNRSRPYEIPIGSSGLTAAEAVHSEMVGTDGRTYYGPDAYTYTYADDGTLLQVLPGSDGVPDDLDTRYRDAHESPEQLWGQPEREQRMVFVNAGYELGDGARLYAFGNYSTKDQTGGFYYRRAGVAQLSPLRTADGSIWDPRRELFPAGFRPMFSGEVEDYSAVAGVEGLLGSGWTYDVSARYGYSDINYFLENTLNPAMGPDTPTSFEVGTLASDELALNADFSYALDVGLFSPLNVAFGFEYREEGYEIGQGDEAGRTVGPYAQMDPWNFNTTADEVAADGRPVGCYIPGLETPGTPCAAGDPIFNAVAIGSNGMPGFVNEVDYERDSRAAYLDVEADVTDRWLLSSAIRYEKFSDFGDTGNWKLATRYNLLENLSVRASLGTGFRAPTPGQIATQSVSTTISDTGIPESSGIYPAWNPVAAFFGAEELAPEESFSYTFGITATPTDALTFTVDAYNIDLKDRIVISSDFRPDGLTAERYQQLLEASGGIGDVAQVSFFTNDLDTRTRGIDVVAEYDIESRFGLSTLSAALNHNQTEITKRPLRTLADGSTGYFVDDQDVFNEENGLPSVRGNVALRHGVDKWDLMVRANYYGESEWSDGVNTQTFSDEILVDLEATYRFTPKFSTTLGGQNIFDSYPDPAETADVCCGQIYSGTSVVPWMGAFYFLRANLHL